VHPGPYIVLPIAGPSTVRDAFGRLGDEFITPQNYIVNNWTRYGLDGLYYLDLRARLLDVEGALDSAYDRYAVLRSVYLQRRQYRVTEGAEPADEAPVDDPLLDEAAPEAREKPKADAKSAAPAKPDADAKPATKAPAEPAAPADPDSKK